MAELQQLIFAELKKIARTEAEKAVKQLLPGSIDEHLSSFDERLCMVETAICDTERAKATDTPRYFTGRELIIFRKRHHLTQRQMAALLSTNCTSICRWEKGHIHPNAETSRRFWVLQTQSHQEILCGLDEKNMMNG